jgi:hypothetical protein
MGVQIFAKGKWNGDEYSTDDLDQMVQAFEENKDHVRPFLKLGHDNDQKLLQKEGLPAAGWVERIYREGDHLYADFAEIPQKVYQLIERKAYRKVSCEIYCNVQINERKYKYLVGAVALLGAETPGVMSLDDILAQYKLTSHAMYATYAQSDDIKVYETENQTNQGEKTMEKTERELQLEKELAEAKAATLALETEKTKLEADKKDYEAKAIEAEGKLFAAEVERTADQLASEKLITPAMRPYAVQLLGAEKKTYKVGEKELTKFEMLKELCKLFQAAGTVNLEESSTDGKDAAKKDESTQETLIAEVEKYALENKKSFSEAYRIVAKGHEEKLKPKSLVEE